MQFAHRNGGELGTGAEFVTAGAFAVDAASGALALFSIDALLAVDALLTLDALLAVDALLALDALLASVVAVGAATDAATLLSVCALDGVARGSGVRIVVKLLDVSPLVALESEVALALAVFCVASAELLKPASVGSGTGQNAKNNPAAMRAKIMAPMIMAP